MLNPPFSCRGGTRYPVQTPAGRLTASTALSFILLATQYVADTGHIATVLPANSLHSQKDAVAWQFLRARYDVHHLHTWAKGTFPRSAATTVSRAPITGQTHHH